MKAEDQDYDARILIEALEKVSEEAREEVKMELRKMVEN